ncbi:MAG: phosphoribosylglycinamide formyltransferase [Steroidobacteraceae bacterium]|nr:phosphoribosylglycinamide formyltransferase [Steroidobacteraceae bacterium]MDW8260027.1 phosphoribosylglycinamide formyltransferase [Gammaproteobacteria bacterium]
MSEQRRLPLVVLISGYGSNLLAIDDYCRSPHGRASIVRVIADRPQAVGIERARARGLPTVVVDYRSFASRRDFEYALAQAIDAALPEPTDGLILLAGFLRILGDAFVARYAGRLLNIHPSLLPAYPGLDTHRRALEDGATEHGATVHYVTAQLDGGPIIAQARVPILPDDDPQRLSARVQRAEHKLYSEVVDSIARGAVRYENGVVIRDGKPQSQPPCRTFSEP